MRRRRDDSGAVAIIVAVGAAMLMMVAALGVDLGNLFVTKQESQKQADFAALAGGQGDDLPTSATTQTCPYGARGNATDQAVKDVAAYLGTRSANSTVTPAQLVDCDVTNGEVLYGTFTKTNANSTHIALSYDKNTLTVITPNTRVAFGLAQVAGFQGADINSQATVQIGTQNVSSLPLYAFTGCDFGGQTIAQPTNGQAAAHVLLSHASDTNTSVLTSLTTNPATNPAQVPVDVASPNDSLVVNGTGLTGITKVGYFESGTSGPGPEPVISDLVAGDFTVNALGTQITVPHLPVGVTGVQDFWYVRVFNGVTGKWSAVTTGNGANITLAAPVLRVGTPTLTCGQGSSAGNFGTLLLTNTDGPNGQADNIAYNIAAGLQHKLGLFPAPATPYTCTQSTTGALLWPSEGTNCVDTKTGLDLNAAQKGFIDGVGGKPGLLTKVGANTGCKSDGTSNTTVFGAYTINNDTLSCFFTDSTTNVGDVSSSTYALGAPAISSAIYNSPRFVEVPVLGAQPSNGGSAKYEIIGMRAGFITDQVASATQSTPPTTYNGVSGTGGNVSSIQVVFINTAALPPPPDPSGPLGVYAGSGSKTLRMVN